MIAGEIEVELVPAGHAGGAHPCRRCRASAVILTATGLGTPVAEGKQTVEVDDRTYLLETPIRADFALIGAKHADFVGNLDYSLTAHNFNPIMAMAADTVIAEPAEIVPVGVIPPDEVKTPGVLVDYI